MATTLLEPKVKIYRWTSDTMDVLEFEEHLRNAMNRIRGLAVSETMKITWLAPTERTLLCVIEWCEWAKE